jgi:hypothetical protein
MLVSSLWPYMHLENLLRNCISAYFSQEIGHRDFALLSKYLFEFDPDGIMGTSCVCMRVILLDNNINM